MTHGHWTVERQVTETSRVVVNQISENRTEKQSWKQGLFYKQIESYWSKWSKLPTKPTHGIIANYTSQIRTKLLKSLHLIPGIKKQIHLMIVSNTHTWLRCEAPAVNGEAPTWCTCRTTCVWWLALTLAHVAKHASNPAWCSWQNYTATLTKSKYTHLIELITGILLKQQ